MNTATFALVIGVAFLAAGIIGLIPAALFPPPADAPPTTFTMLYGYLLGLFPVNLLHSAVHVAIGVWGIFAGRGAFSAKVFARSLALLYGVLAVMGLIPGLNTLFGFIPLHGHDVWLHAGTAALAAYFGWRSEEDSMDRRETIADRRQRMLPVARERRLGLTDRRQLAYIGH
jgi:hypothetical protein